LDTVRRQYGLAGGQGTLQYMRVYQCVWIGHEERIIRTKVACAVCVSPQKVKASAKDDLG